MPRLFVGQREVDFFNDITREIMKDIVGQVVYYYSIDYARTMVDSLYNESPEKVFDAPIELAARVKWNPQEVITNEFGQDAIRELEVFIHIRDVIERNVKINAGDFISFGDSFYEIISSVFADIVMGQPEYSMGYQLQCIQSRQDEFMSKVIGPTWEGYSDDDAVKHNFHQQRGVSENAEGPTGDVRDLVRKGVLDEPLTGPREVSERGSDISGESTFYDE